MTQQGIPPVSDYAHWNEEAEAMWFAENRYDMEHADEMAEEYYERLTDEYEEYDPADEEDE